MTVEAETNSIIYSCNGVLTAFDFDFKVFKTADVKVILITVATGAETVLTETTHYAITGSLSSGGKVTTVATYSSDYELFICLDMAVEQETDLVYGGSYSNEAIETMSDRLTKIAQQQAEKLGRAITFKRTSDESDVEIEDLVADKTIVVNAGGTGLEMGPSTDEIENAQTYAEAAAAAQTAAELAETNAGASKDAADADVLLTNADVVSTNADALSTAADVVSTNADALSTAADAVQTGLDAAATAQDAIDTAADVVLAAAQAAALIGTSTTSLLIEIAEKTFTTQASKQFAAGMFVLAVSDADPANYIHGQVTSYSGTTLVVNVIDIGGSGTLADWTISVSGSRGAIGATGSGNIATDTIGDEAEIIFTTAKTGWGRAMAGDNEEYIEFRFTAAGVVTVISNSANAINTDTDGFLCVYDAGAGIAIKNRLGATKTIRYGAITGSGNNATDTIGDEAEITLTTAKTGWGRAMAGDNEEYIEFRFTATGVVTVISNSANAINTDTDGFLCVYDAGTGIRIKNRLGATKTIRYIVNYS